MAITNMKKLPDKDILSDPITYVTDPGTLTVNLSTFEVSVHDGVTPGGLPVGGGGPLPPGVATEAYVDTAISNLVDGAPAMLDTLNELAAALADDANFATTMTTALGNKADTSSLAPVATSGLYSSLTGTPVLATVATSGSYSDLLNIPLPLGSHLLNIDRRRTDTYVADGSSDRPFKTIAAAVAQAVSNGDGASTPYSFIVAEGTYAEGINLNSTGLSNVSLVGLGRVAIDPVSGNALTCTSGNSGLKQLVIRNMEFADPVVITGDSTADQFNNVVFYDVAMGVLTATCMNSLNIRGAYISGTVTLSNVAWFYWDGVQHDAQTVTVISDTTATLPAWGMANAGGYFVGGKFQDLVFTRTGTGNFNMNINSCYTGLTAGAYTVPVGFTVNARNSTMRGTWTNSGTMNLYSSTVLNPIGGAGTTNYPGITGAQTVRTSNVTFPDGTQSGAAISITDLQTLVAACADFDAFKTAIAAL